MHRSISFRDAFPLFAFGEMAYRTANTPGFPQHDFSRSGEDAWDLTLAVPGFPRDAIKIEQAGDTLTISGERKPVDETDDAGREVLHRGISLRAGFKASFRMGEYIKVSGASLKDGLLSISLKREIPEAERPRTIDIAG